VKIATLPMYESPPLRAAHDRVWRHIAAQLSSRGISDVPLALNRDSAPRQEDWVSPNLLLSQTCGYPLMYALKEQATLVATPAYVVQGHTSSNYCSYVMVREDDSANELKDLRGRRVVFNGTDSQSGYSALRHAVAPLAGGGTFFSQANASGKHLDSMQWVRDGRADVCAVDCVTYELARRWQPASVAGLRKLCDTAWAPNLPYITAGATGEAQLVLIREALSESLQDPRLADDCDAMALAGIEIRPLTDYGRIVEMEEEAKALGYPELR
jgi:ABC-type phosphate/phosphonate transport system substrate-binding protein